MNNGEANVQDVFVVYKQAVERFHKACKVFRDADHERSESENALHEISQRVAQVLQEAVQDPTIPVKAPAMPDAMPNMSGNITLAGGRSSLYSSR